ncbi:MAG: hypothetical protein PHN74_00985 [Candidatus Pacebacteria bacterium]|nr:hypothetical protein [Candidatus Paceibacterota bacterium]
MIIGIDLDEILADSLNAIVEFHNKKYGTTLKRNDFHSYRFWEIWGGTREEAIKKVYEFFITNPMHINPIAGSFEALKTLKKNGHELLIITARQNELIEYTNKWIEKHFPEIFSGIHYANTYTMAGHSRKKSDICNGLGIKLLIEDDLTHAEDCAKSGIKILLLDCPWNQNSLPKNTERIFSWNDAVDKILNQ